MMLTQRKKAGVPLVMGVATAFAFMLATTTPNIIVVSAGSFFGPSKSQSGAVSVGTATTGVVKKQKDGLAVLFGNQKTQVQPPNTVLTVKGGNASGSVKNTPTTMAASVKVETAVVTTSTASTSIQPPNTPPSTSLSDTKPDSVTAFADDVAKVLNELRADRFDPTVPMEFHSMLRPTFAVLWNHEMWDRHTSAWRFIDAFLFWHKSALLRRVLPQLIGLLLWTYGAIRIVDNQTTMIAKVKFDMTSLSLVSGFVGSLIALRSNQGLARMMDGRMIFGKVVLYTRDMASLVNHFVYPNNKDLALKLARHLTLFSWLLKGFLRGEKVTGSDEDLVRTMLSKVDADYVMVNRKKPVAIVMRLRQALAHLSHEHALTTAEEMAIDHSIQSMDTVIMLSERLVASPIPPLFTTHASRLLMFYLFFLPIALHSTGKLNTIGTMVTVAAVGYAMLGLEEISALMEQPFKYAPLYDLCKNSMRDIADALCVREPSLDSRKNVKYNPAVPQPYWPEKRTDGLEASIW
jgi:predicted membrane chloride channel (bestrophin family)